jgi:hypothetical protein
VKFKFRLIFLFFSLSIFSNVYGQLKVPYMKQSSESSSKESINSFSERLVKEISRFEKACIGKQNILLATKILVKSLNDCETEGIYLERQINLYQKAVLETEELENFSTCKQENENSELVELINVVDKVGPKISCSPEEIKEKNESCGKVWTCNALRSVMRVADLSIPRILAKPIRKYASEKAEAINGGCLDEGKSDCIKELVTTLAGSLMDTGKALWELTKAGASSLFNVSDWFSSKSESMQAAAIQNKESVTSFLDSPGEWIMNLLNSLSSSVNSWVKSSVLCQEWSGEPHLSECVTPLASYDCIDCESQVNSVCSVAGAVISEVGIMALTAGAGNIASIGVRAGAASMRAIAKKAATKMKIKNPNLGLGLKGTGLMANPIVGKVVVSTINAARVTSVVAKKSLKDIKSFLNKVENTRVVKVTKKVVDKTINIVADPTRIGKIVAEKTYSASSKVVKAVGPKSMSKLAKKDLDAMETAKLNGGKGRHAIRDQAKASKVSSTVKIHKTAQNAHTNASKDNIGARVSRQDSNRISVKTDKHNPPETSRPEPKIKVDKVTDVKSQKPKIESNTASSDKSSKGRKNHGEEDDGQYSRPGPAGAATYGANHRLIPRSLPTKVSTAGLVAVGVDVGVKLDNAMEREAGREEIGASASNGRSNSESSRGGDSFSNSVTKQQSRKKNSKNIRENLEKRFGQAEVSSESQLKSVLGLSDSDSSSQVTEKAIKKAETLSTIYSEQNREQMIQKMQQKNQNLNAKDAQVLFNQRQAQVKSAKQFLKAKTLNSDFNQVDRTQKEAFSSKSVNDAPAEKTKVKSDKAAKKRRSASTEALKREFEELKGQVAEMDNDSPVDSKINTKEEALPVSSKPSRSRGATSPRQVSVNNFPNNPAVGKTSFVDSSFVGYKEPEKKTKHGLGTYHPDVLEGKEKAQEGSRKIASVDDSSTEGEKPAVLRETSANQLYNLFGSENKKPEVVSHVADVPVNLNLETVQSAGDVNRLLAFKRAIEKFSKASSVDRLKDQTNTYDVYKFNNDEVFGIATDLDGVQRLLSDIEIKDLF